MDPFSDTEHFRMSGSLPEAGVKKGLYFFAFEEHLMEKIGVSAEHHKLVWFIAIEVTYKDFTQKKEEYTLI